jgi:hypothetical protein
MCGTYVTASRSARVRSGSVPAGIAVMGRGPVRVRRSSAGSPACSIDTVGVSQPCRRTTVRESDGSGFDSAATALLTCSTPRTPEELRRTGRAPSLGTAGHTVAKRDGRAVRDSNSGLTARNRPSNVQRVAPRQTERSRPVRIRSLRTQQRAESQCQVLPRGRGLGPVIDWLRSCCGFLWYTTSTQLVETSDHSVGTPARRGRSGKPYKAFTESLILAQDERWRRA